MNAGEVPGLRVQGLSVRLPGQALPVLADASIEVRRGEVVGVCGRSGSGKSTFLHAVAGLVPWAHPAEVDGAIMLDGDPLGELDPGQRAHLLTTCLDRPDSQLFLGTVRQELEAAERLHGEAPLAARVREGLGLESLLDRRVTELSSGERQRLALAVTLAGAPRPVLLDEPTVHLDESGVAALRQVLGEIRALGGCVLLAEQAGFRLAGTVDRWLRLEGGMLTPCPPPASPTLRRAAGTPGEVVLEVENVRLVRAGRTLLDGASLAVRAGEVVVLSGRNGAGKTSLARALAGHAAAAGGGLAVASGRIRRPPGAALILPDAGVQLFAATVASEIALAGLDEPAIAAGLRRHRLEHLGGRAPWTLSRGEQQRLTHAAVDALQPPVTVVDEPGQGLDPEDLAELADLIARRAESGSAYLIVSQRPELTGLAHRHVVIADARLVDAGGRP
jgi:energy-coupling factor transporter ATP-binding protein EcfA2